MHLHHQTHAPVGELVERTKECYGRIVDENVWRADLLDYLGEESFTILGFGEVGRRRQIADPPNCSISSRVWLRDP